MRALFFCCACLAALGCRGGPLELPEDHVQPACAQEGLQACEQACDGGDAQACLAAATAYERGLSVRADREAMKTFELRACDLGDADGCLRYGRSHINQEGEDLDLAGQYFDRACEAGLAKGCMHAGSVALRLDDEGEPRDARAAVGYYQRACNAGEATACNIMGDLRTFGVGTPRDLELARASFQKACDAGHPVGCNNVDGEQHWVSTPGLVFEALHTPDPYFQFANAPSGWETQLSLRVCVEEGKLEPTAVAIVESSNEQEIDAFFVETLQGWRIRVREDVEPTRPLCLFHVFFIRQA